MKVFSDYKKIALNSMFLSIMEATQIIMPFIALPFIIKTIGSDNYGKVVFAQSICAYFTIIVTFGLEYLGAKEISVHRDDKIACGKILGTVLVIKSVICAVCFILFSLLILLWDRTNRDSLVYFFSFGACVSDIVFTHWLFQGLEKMFMITAIKSTSLLIYLSLILVFLKKTNDYPLVPLFQSTSLIFTSLIGMIYTVKVEKIRPIIPSTSKILLFAKNSFPFFLSRISVIFNGTMTTTVIGITLGDFMVAVFDLASKITKGAEIPVYMITQAIYPHNAKYRDFKLSSKVFLFTITVTACGLVVLYFVAPTIADFLSNGELMDSVKIIRFLLPYLLLDTISVYLGSPTLVAWGYPKPFNHSVIVSSFVLATIYLLYYIFKVNNILFFCVALYICQIVGLLYRFIFFIKYKIYATTPIE